MIKTFRHRGLERYFSTGDARGLRSDQLNRIRRILGVLEAAASIETLQLLPGTRLHPLKGDLAGNWSVSVSGNWRIIFRFDAGDFYDVDFVDYH
jgi:toxin HigB-1